MSHVNKYWPMREPELLAFLAEGLSPPEIAQRMDIRLPIICHRISHLRRKDLIPATTKLMTTREVKDADKEIKAQRKAIAATEPLIRRRDSTEPTLPPLACLQEPIYTMKGH